MPIGRHGVGVYNVNGTFYAIANYCPHEGGPLCSGRARGRTVVDEKVPGDAVMVRDLEFIYCPWHQWGFELATGTTAVKPEWSIRTYPVRVVGNDVLVQAMTRRHASEDVGQPDSSSAARRSSRSTAATSSTRSSARKANSSH